MKALSLLVGAVVVGGIAFAMNAGGESDSADRLGPSLMNRRIHPVTTLSVHLQDGYDYQQTYLGEVVANRSSNLGFERAGRIVGMDISEGDVFEAGTVLAQLDTERLLEQRKELLARTAGIQARLDELTAGARQEKISAAQSTVKDLEHQLELAKRTLQRRQNLIDRGTISPEALDTATFQARSIAAKLDVARHNLDELKTGTRTEILVAQQSALMQSQSLVAQNRIEVERSILRAPYDCTITVQMADVGQVVGQGSQILSVIANNDPEVWVGIPVEGTTSLKKGKQAGVDINGQIHDAVVRNIIPQMDQATRTMTVILSLKGTTIQSVPVGQTARLSLNRQTAERGCWLPMTALIKGTRGLWSCLRLVEKTPDFETDQSPDTPVGVLERCDIEILHSDGDRVYVRSVLDEGDRVVRSGTARVAPRQWAHSIESAKETAQ